MFTIKKILLDFMEEAAGVTSFPVLSWQFATEKKNFRQSTFQIQAAEKVDFTQLIYDSGEMAGKDSNGIKPHVKLQSGRRYYVRVRAAAEGKWCPWSEPVSFLTGNIAENWQGKFISAETPADKDNSKGTYLRKEIQLGKEVEQAVIYTTALGLYQFFINGQRIGREELAPGWTAYQKRLSYQTYEVTEYLKNGRNELRAHMGAGWYKGMLTFHHVRNLYGEQTAFFGQLHVRYTDGTEEVFATDESWQGADSPVLFAEIYGGETYDAGKVEPDAGAWHKVQLVDYPLHNLQPQTASPIRKTAEIPVQNMLVTPKGEHVLDFGQNMSGWVKFKVRGAKGTQVKLHCFEVLDKEGNVYLENLREAKETIIYIKGTDKEEVFTPHFTYQGFQYAWLEEWSEDAQADDFTAQVLHSDMPQTGSFTCSEKLINQLQHNILWGLKGNFLDVPTDCPQRDERLGWTGDAEIFSSTANFLVNTHAFYQKWLGDLVAEQADNGAVPHVVPDVLTPVATPEMIEHMGMDGASGWADAATIVPWNLYLATGDIAILRRQYDSMKKWVSFMEARMDEQGRFNYKMQFGDWLALDGDGKTPLGATPTPFTCSVYHLVSLEIVARSAKILGYLQEAAAFNQKLEKLLRRFRTNYLPEGELTVKTQSAYAMVLAYKLVPADVRPKLAKELADMLEEDGHLVTGFMGTPCLCQALSENGQTAAAWKLLEREEFPGWLYPVKQGATTIWEHWDGKRPDGSFCSPDMNSFNHYAYGAIGDWLYRYGAGLDYDEREPGYKLINFHPQPGGSLHFAEACHETPYGKAAIKWERSGREITVKMTVPPNAGARLTLPEGASVQAAEGLNFKNGTSQVFGSGEWEVRYLA